MAHSEIGTILSSTPGSSLSSEAGALLMSLFHEGPQLVYDSEESLRPGLLELHDAGFVRNAADPLMVEISHVGRLAVMYERT